MATYDAKHTVYPTIGEIIQFIAIKSGLVSSHPDIGDEAYAHLKPFAKEQRGKDFSELDTVLDMLEYRLDQYIAPPGVGVICIEVFRRFLQRYKSLILRTRVYAWSREQFVEEVLIPDFVVPHAAWLLCQLNKPPFDFMSAVELLRAMAPLKVAFSYFLSLKDAEASWTDMSKMYAGKARTYGDAIPVHDIEDKRKLIHKWGTAKATPSFETCLQLLESLDLAEFSGYVFWTWIARFLQKIDLRYRDQIADAIECDMALPTPKELAERVTQMGDKRPNLVLSQDAQMHLRMLTTLLFYNRHRHQGDKARVEALLALVKEAVGESPTAKFYVTWLDARYHLYCRDMNRALKGYEQAFNEGMYMDSQAETCILPEWAAIAQKAKNAPALKRIDSRMRMLGMYPEGSAEEVAAMRLKVFSENLGAGRCFHEAFRSGETKRRTG